MKGINLVSIRRFSSLILVITAMTLIAACEESGADNDLSNRNARIITTTTMLRDAVENVGGDHVEVESLMGPGVDPHSYRASESDVTRMAEADIIIYNGLHLEGRISDVLEQLDETSETLAVAENVDESRLISPNPDILEDFPGQYDPHIWFDVTLWQQAIEVIRDALIDLDPDNAESYEANTDAYLAELTELNDYMVERITEIPDQQRVLITAHDAFGYFGHAYDIEVRGLQPVTTSIEAGAGDVREMVDYIVERKIPALFLETAVPPQGILAVQEAVQSAGHDIEIGGELYGDALGDPDSEEGTYIGAVRHNIDTIVDALAQ